MTDRGDGPWDPPTEHDDQHDADLSGEDPPTVRASETQRAKARDNAIASQLANANVIAKPPAAAAATPPQPATKSTTLPPPTATRTPATRTHITRPPPEPRPPAQDVVVLDRVSGNMPIEHAPRRSESAAGGIVVVATGPDADRLRKLCHKHGLLVPVMTSLAVVHDAMSIVVIGEPSPPAPDGVVHVVRPTIADDKLLDLLRALAGGRVVVEPPALDASNTKVSEAARRLATLTDRAAIETTTIEAITALTAADRAHCLFHDPVSGALWSEVRRRTGRDDRQAMSGLVGWAAQTGQTVHASPAGDDPRWQQELDDPDGKPQSRLLVQPIVGGDRRVHAVLVVVRRWSHADFSDAETRALAAFAALAGPALDLAVAASPPQPAKRTTAPLGAAASKSALVGAPRAQGDSRPPPVTARKSGSGSQPPPLATPASGAPTTPAASAPVDDPTRVDERYSSESILSLPSPPATPASSSYPPTKRATTSPVSVVDKRTGPVRARNASDSSQPRNRREAEPRDLAVIAHEDDAKRVQRIAKNHRLELSTFTKVADAPEFYQVVTLGETWSSDDGRVAYAARSTITDEQLGDLLAALAHDRVVVPAPPLVKPQSAAEARRSQLAFAGARKLAALTDLAAAETLAIATLQDLLDTDRAYLWLVDPPTGALWSETRKRAEGDDRRAIAGIAGWVARTGRAVNVPRASADPRWLGPIDDPEGDPHSQLLMQPIVRTDERVHGVLIAARRARRPGFTETDAALLARFAALAAPLLEQIAVAAEAQQMIGDDAAARAPLPSAPASPLGAILAGTHPLARWLYLVLGVIAGLVIGILAA